eukprot:scaffold1521_cov271-Chaetoceros_neogracile.AAC.67
MDVPLRGVTTAGSAGVGTNHTCAWAWEAFCSHVSLTDPANKASVLIAKMQTSQLYSSLYFTINPKGKSRKSLIELMQVEGYSAKILFKMESEAAKLAHVFEAKTGALDKHYICLLLDASNGASKHAVASDYTLVSTIPYKLTTQLRNAKQSSQSEHSLMDARTDSFKIKFHGKLETTPDCTTEYDKEEFLTALKEQVNYYGLHNFFAMPATDGTMHNLLSSSHLFELEDVLTEYNSRVIQNDPVVDAVSLIETDVSIAACFRQYDVFELFDQALSRLVVESLLSTSFREVIKEGNGIVSLWI